MFMDVYNRFLNQNLQLNEQHRYNPHSNAKLRLRACKLVESLRHGRVRGPQRPDLIEDQAMPRRVPRTFLRQACWSDLHV